MYFSWYFQQKSCFKVVVGGVKIGEAIVFLIAPYYKFYSVILLTLLCLIVPILQPQVVFVWNITNKRIKNLKEEKENTTSLTKYHAVF